MTDAREKAQNTARDVGDHALVEKGARLGFAMSGLIHLLIGWIALKIAWGIGSTGSSSGESADKSGALREVAGGTTGPFLLGLAVLGFALLALWNATEAVVGRHGGETLDRAKAGGKAILYAVFAWSAFGFARGAGGSDEQKTDSITSSLMSQPGGRILVGLVGVAVVGAGAYHVWKGWTKGFLEELERHPGRWAEVAGRAGYVAKGIALAVAGLLFAGPALSSRASEAGGLDSALKELRDRPFGPYVLTVIALGIAAYGLYSFARARHAKL
ncbi:DUF1206 domain-containing protein [Knoellia subterranea]|uniref:DUF1206 domain-containing protein n=1 Tax=Knoellia subterranea KCTC 19937 TaxID=1385521 RepID=A0A0A0JJ94_9MICO|nr:DUF1206 domain-containing protein [Knoellia subterranea]KGN37158.1 hypothetical protein N803_14980 [Knoellia subterranea KCTC 19937]